MSSRIMSVLTLFVLSGSAYSQLIKPEAVPFLGLEQVTAQVKMDVFAVEIIGNQSNDTPDDDWITLGTGFFLSGNNDDRQTTRLRCITCYHVVKSSVDYKTQLFIGLEGTSQYHRVQSRTVYLDPTNDVAVFQIVSNQATLGQLVTHTFLRNEVEAKPILAEGTGLVIPGYPLGLGTQANKNHPVVRFGIVAQSPGGSHFLIDGVANHGNSGSPVVRLRDQKVVGMVTAHLADKINLLDERGQLTAQLPYNSGLTRAISSEILVQILSKLDETETKDVQP